MTFEVRYVVLLFSLVPMCVGTEMAFQQQLIDPLALPCPSETLIAPCECTVRFSNDMDMNCSLVADENDLARVFSNDFPFPDFIKLIIDGNHNLRDLRPGDFGSSTFMEIEITNGGLEVVVSLALANSYSTLTTLDLSGNSLRVFPFDEVSSMTKLTYFNAAYNNLESLLDIESTSLTHFFLQSNLIQDISASSFQKLPALVEIGLHNNSLTTVPPATFERLNNLEKVHLEFNSINDVQAGTFDLSTTNNLVHLFDNSIATVAIGAIDLEGGDVWIQNNQLTDLYQSVWQPLFDKDVNLYAAGNDLDCDCDIAWIVLNGKYMNNLLDDVTCNEGTLVTELDPGIYVDCP